MADVVVSDIAAQKIALAISAAATSNTAALLAHSAAINAIYDSTNPLGGGKPGSIASILSGSSKQILSLTDAVKANTEAINKLTVATGKIAASVETLTKAAGTIQFTMTKQLTTQQLVAADQIKNNKFNQLTTNEAKERAGLPPTEVGPDNMVEGVKGALADINLINAQTAATTIILDTATETTKEGFAIAQKWIVESAFADWIKSYWAESKIQVQILFADEKTKADLESKLDAIRQARQNPVASK